MAWDNTRCREGIPAPDLNNDIRDQYIDLEAALTKEMHFSTGETPDSQQGIFRQGSAIIFIQNTEPATRPNGDSFTSIDNGRLWIKPNSTPVDQFNFLSDYSGPTWTPVSAEIIAVLLASARTFAAAVTFDVAAILSKAPTLTEGIVGNNSNLQARNAVGDGNADMIKVDGNDKSCLPDGAVLAAATESGDGDRTIADKAFVAAQKTVTAARVKAWVTFNSSGTILDSYNVSGVVRNDTGKFTISWDTAFADTNYCISVNGYPSAFNYVMGSAQTGSVQVGFRNTSANYISPTKGYVMAIGTQ